MESRVLGWPPELLSLKQKASLLECYHLFHSSHRRRDYIFNQHCALWYLCLFQPELNALRHGKQLGPDGIYPMMRFKESRLWTTTESGNLSVRTARHPGQGGLELCKPGWRVFSSPGSHASHPDLSFIPVSCCLKFFLLRSHKWECVYRLNYITTQSSVKKPLFSGFQNHCEQFEFITWPFCLLLLFLLCPASPVLIPTVTQIPQSEKDQTVSKNTQT